METIDYKTAIAALLVEDYDRDDRAKLANKIADDICIGYKDEIEYLQKKYGDFHEERLDDTIRNGLVHVTYTPGRKLTESERNKAVKVLESVIFIVEALEVLRQKGVAR